MAGEGALDLARRRVRKHLPKLGLERCHLASFFRPRRSERLLCESLGPLQLEDPVGVEAASLEGRQRRGEQGVQEQRVGRSRRGQEHLREGGRDLCDGADRLG